MTQQDSTRQYIESRLEVKTFLKKLEYLLDDKATSIQIAINRSSDRKKSVKYRNSTAIYKLFPDIEPKKGIIPVLKKLMVSNYIKTTADDRFKNRDDFRVFGYYHKKSELYIKLRAQIIDPSKAGLTNCVFVMSFHFTTIPFKKVIFPYARRESK